MNRLQLKDKISDIDYLQKEFSRFQVLAIDIIPKLKNTFNKYEIVTSEVSDNSFTFKFWGLDFISKTEIIFDSQSNLLTSAEINTYLISDENKLLIQMYSFDHIGNINQFSSLSNFAEYYYIDFVTNLIKISSKENIKFQLF